MLSKEVAKAVRAAIQGWGPTLRFVAIMTAGTVCMILIRLAM